MALLLGVLLFVIPRLLLPPQPSRLHPMVAEFGLVALHISVVHQILSQEYAVVTWAQYEQLTPGMHLLAVEHMLGFGAEIKTQNLPNDEILITYEWLNPDGSKIIATFQNMKLTGKAQAGLK
ncbi:hypothetical protein [Leptothoe spongobia]|uniref:Uncharacterized protein n=1 Tax=Leptothoe spongobia TAU-MAC 1115 TaxID=1967444 RepID=A0A947DG33_9CYAN|nr:hypothetical protein [Leptothoe spongobia]MBT9315933.1 hypothetical protein [Leptothoe spongobia TAU-MAC 1115]